MNGEVYMGVHIDRQRIQEESLNSTRAVRGARLMALYKRGQAPYGEGPSHE
jgi:hypothetical protein